VSAKGRNLADKTRVLIVAEAWLDLAEQTTPIVERESAEAHGVIEHYLSKMTSPRHALGSAAP
jgi:hypothetical protein